LSTISANELKIGGVSALETYLEEESEVLISVHGKTKYVVMSIETYQHFREIELQQAILETENDIKQKKYHTDIKKHIKNLGGK